MNEFMPDIAMGVSAMTLKECRMSEVNMEVDGHHELHPLSRDPHAASSMAPHGGYSSRHPHSSSSASASSCTASRKRHAAEAKPDAQQQQQPPPPDLYELSSGRLAANAPYSTAGPPDLYSHGRPQIPGAPSSGGGGGGGGHSPAYAPDQQGPCRGSDSSSSGGLRLDMLEQPPQRLDLALATTHTVGGATATGQVAAAHHQHRAVSGRPKTETDLTCGLGSPPPPPPPQPPFPPEPYEEWAASSRRQLGVGVGVGEGTGSGGGAEESSTGMGGAREQRRSPNKPEYPYRKSAL